MKVLKFGGSSVGNAENIGKVIEIVKKSIEKERCIVVLSAMSGTTDGLINIAKLAENHDESFRIKIKELENKHVAAARTLLGENSQDGVFDFIENRFNELRNICEGVFLLRELSPRTLDRVVSFGEILSTKIVSAKLNSLGVENVWIDARQLIRTDSNFVNANVDFETTNAKIKDFISSSNSKLFIVQGFIGSDSAGHTTTLGRGGSDYTGAIFAAALDADVLEIWTDVSGMMTADPRFVRNVREIPHITYREAMELSHFGAKVIYPPTIQPVMKKGIAVWVKNTFAPDDYGTLIESESKEQNDIIRGISSIDKICLLNLEGSGMIGIPGFSKRLFYSLSKAKINVILITQSSSEHSICVAVDEKSAELAKSVVDAEFEREIELGKIEPLRVETGLSILAIVGDNMKSHSGIAGKMFATLGHNGINIRAIAQGSSERNISAIVETKDVRKAINVLHEDFFSDGKKQINLFIAGVGTVGSRLLAQIKQQADYISENLNLNLNVVGLANSKGLHFEETGINLDDWKNAIQNSEKTNQIAETIIEKNLRNSIFVDVTANSELVEIYPTLLEKSISIVACNKVAASSNFKKYKQLKDLAREYNTNFLFETNVGAGLPIINTLNDLTSSGDKINRIEAVLSGTLQFVFNNYDGSRSFSEVVRQAQNEGYTEPDPRLDLSGTDVARKILILAREAGYKLEMEEIEKVSFLPESCLQGTVEDFYDEMSKHEAHFKAMLDEAKSKNLILKYIATFDNGKASVGLQSIDSTHNFANLSGKDNAVLFYTNRYSEQPLVVKGAGAGADVTAAGVFADIIRATRG
ncbi:MAG: bifunctional aspartate kinase/homoserine dehydrogenase I [Pyrinomonadaceae bacterium]|nr:bifunctional aspartate kinase/homoserine dehydrogenase I [Pyrinomonadaceae bacterium]